jgi:uncharacterized protein
MREDKLIRSGDSGIDGALLRAAKRAVQSGDSAGFDKILAQLNGLSELAAKGKDKALQAQCQSLIDQVGRIVKSRGAAVVVETKAVAALRRVSDEEVEELFRADAVGEITGYGAVFNNVDQGGDVIRPGAFRRTLADWSRSSRLPVMLATHDSRVFPIGVWTSMAEDFHGLKVTGKIANTPRGLEAWALIHMRPSALDGLSIGYSVAKTGSGRSGVRELIDLDLFEISLVSLPMNPLARLELGERGKAVDDVSAAIERFKRLAAQAAKESNVVPFPKPRDDLSDVAEKVAALAANIQATATLMRMKQ